MIKWPEPVGYMPYPVDEKGYTEAQLKQFGRDLLEEAAKVCQQLEVAIDGGGNTYYRPADARQCVYAIRALIKEIPE